MVDEESFATGLRENKDLWGLSQEHEDQMFQSCITMFGNKPTIQNETPSTFSLKVAKWEKCMKETTSYLRQTKRQQLLQSDNSQTTTNTSPNQPLTITQPTSSVSL